MPYTVTASPTALDELALIWTMASDRDAVSRASNKIDAILKSAPLGQGIDLGDYRTLTIEPLTVCYTVSPDDCLVTIRRYIYRG